MRILMLGWELPPKISGGLGVASEGIAEGLASLHFTIDFLLPKRTSAHQNKHLNILDASTLELENSFWAETNDHIEKMKDTELGTWLLPYIPSHIFSRSSDVTEKKTDRTFLSDITLTGNYNQDLFNEIGKYALIATQVARSKPYDLVYCHDWLTLKAGRLIKKLTGIPYVAHIHSTEKDRNGMFAHPKIEQEELSGLKEARHIFAVSKLVKNTLINHYSIKEKNISVIPNAVSIRKIVRGKEPKRPKIAFIGRFTDQKSPSIFIDIARELRSKGKKYEYIMIGDGYLKDHLIDKVNHLNLQKEFEFTGFLDRRKVLKLLPSISLLIVPSISEPFGLVMLEAIVHQIPVLAAKGTGLAEFVPSIPEIDRWDVFNSAQLAERLIEDQSFREQVVSESLKETEPLTWNNSAIRIKQSLDHLV